MPIEVLAKRIGVKVGTIRELCRGIGQDKIPAYRIGKRLMFDVDEVVRWIRTERAVVALKSHVRVIRRPRRSIERSSRRREVRENPATAMRTIEPGGDR